MNFYTWIRDEYATHGCDLNPLIERFMLALRSNSVVSDAVHVHLSQAAPFAGLVDRFMAMIQPTILSARFDTDGHHNALDGMPLGEFLNRDPLVNMSALREHLSVSIAFILRDIIFGKTALYGLDITRSSIFLPLMLCENCSSPVRYEVEIGSDVVTSSRFERKVGIPSSCRQRDAHRHECDRGQSDHHLTLSCLAF